MNSETSQQLLAIATKNVADIINIAIEHKPEAGALVVYDTRYGLTNILTEAYRKALPDARFIDFDKVEKEEVISAFDEMNPDDLVVLIQSSNFLLDAFRIRLHLFNKKLKVIEHLHLYRNTEDVWDVYINSIAYDPSWLRVIGPKLKAKLENIKELRIESGDQMLTVTGGVESPKLNIGDYTGMENIGGTFPIGEVFTEAKDFARMNGSFMLYGYADTDAFTISMHEPFRVDVKESLIVGWQEDAPASFGKIIENIKAFERPIIREIGLGLNRAITRERYMQDITAFERLVGLHFSIGEKHSVYKKEGITAHKSKFHVDVFPVADRILADGEVIFEGGKYTI
ncbi:MAG: hypothetical protein HZB10_02245 [Candidatus Yonathbacteria bacterium]|nr:hypothetical protein [Candidatus Yonathbacteria bacterium]